MSNVQPFCLPLSQEVDIDVDAQGCASFRMRKFQDASFRLKPQEFAALIELLTLNGEKLLQEIGETNA